MWIDIDGGEADRVGNEVCTRRATFVPVSELPIDAALSPYL